MKLFSHKKIKSGVTLLFKKKKKDPYLHDAEGDWEKILISLTVLLIIILIIEGIFFYMLNEGKLFREEVSESTPVEVFNRNLMKENNDFYDAREERFNALQSTSTPVIDPYL